jgi:hypothetical protein
MSHGIEKETFVNADEKTYRALTFDLLDKLYGTFEGHAEEIGDRLRTVENRKKKDTATASLFGFVGGFVAMATYYMRSWLSGK